MKTSASIELVWQLAGQEAIAAKFKEIEPEHFFEALMKFSELPVEEVDRIAPGSDAARELAGEVAAVREEVSARSIDSTQARRKLRGQLGQGNTLYDGGSMHRSQASRKLFDAAAKLAAESGGEVLLPRHLLAALLSSPTPPMAQVLGEAAAAPKAPVPAKAPLFDGQGVDLTRLASEGKLQAPADRQAESKAVIQMLAREGRTSLMLVHSGQVAAEAVVNAVAIAIVGGTVPATLKNKRVIDLREAGNRSPTFEDIESLHVKLLADAAKVADVIVVECLVPPKLEAGAYSDALKRTLSARSVQCIVLVGSADYKKWIAKEPGWKKLAHPIWISGGEKRELPNEL